MIINNQTKAYHGLYFLKFRNIVGLAITTGILLLLSSYCFGSSLSSSGTVGVKWPRDTMEIAGASSIDHELKDQLLKELKMRQLKDSLISYAKNFEGRPYIYGAKGPKSFDCSGFVKFVYKHFNLDLERTSRDQSRQGEEIPLDQVQKGDLLFFTGLNRKNRRVGHVAIVVSNADEKLRFIHSASHGGVKVGALDNYFEPRLLHARRVLQLDMIAFNGIN